MALPVNVGGNDWDHHRVDFGEPNDQWNQENGHNGLRVRMALGVAAPGTPQDLIMFGDVGGAIGLYHRPHSELRTTRNNVAAGVDSHAEFVPATNDQNDAWCFGMYFIPYAFGCRFCVTMCILLVCLRIANLTCCDFVRLGRVETHILLDNTTDELNITNVVRMPNAHLLGGDCIGMQFFVELLLNDNVVYQTYGEAMAYFNLMDAIPTRVARYPAALWNRMRLLFRSGGRFHIYDGYDYNYSIELDWVERPIL